MADLGFVRANRNNPVRAGEAVSLTPGNLPSGGSINHYIKDSLYMPPSGEAYFAQTILVNKFRNYGYYVGETGYPPDNTGVPVF